MALFLSFYFFFFSSTSRQEKSIRHWRYLTSNKNINMTNFIHPLNIPLLKTKKKHSSYIHMLELHTSTTWSLRQAPPSSTFLWDAPGTLSGLHMSSDWKDDVKDGCTRRNGPGHWYLLVTKQQRTVRCSAVVGDSGSPGQRRRRAGKAELAPPTNQIQLSGCIFLDQRWAN